MTSNGLGKDDRHHSPTVGADISKLTLDVYLHPQATAREFANSATGIKALLAWLGQSPVHCIVFEPTGAYHRILERQLGDVGAPTVKVDRYRRDALPKP